MLWSNVVLAAREIRRNVFRSGLTVLGVVIGVAAVVAIATIGGGATARITGDLATLGVDLLIVSPGGERRGPPMAGGFGGRGRRFSMKDVRALAALKTVRAAAPTSMYPTLVSTGEDRRQPAVLTGTTVDFAVVNRVEIQDGTWFDPDAERPQCVLGASVAEQLFGDKGPDVGAEIRHAEGLYVVSGVLSASDGRPMRRNLDRTIFVPIETLPMTGANRVVDTILVRASTNDVVESAREDVSGVLREHREITEDMPADFSIRGVEQMLSMVRQTTGILTAVIGSIAGISLLVGGIGITNVMLVTITERTREIGVRMSIGARSRDVLLQFLIESSMLTGAGGLLGIALGLGGGLVATRLIELPFRPNLLVVAGVFAFSVLLGLVFGILPARRAALMNPVDALRHE